MEFKDSIGRREDCPKCHADVHACKNCQHYDAKVYNECKEPSAEVVREKERANFCDYFSPKNSGKTQDNKTDLMNAAEALFKKQ
jgi:hypothetical protein